MKQPKILLTGATGFVGGATLAHLLEHHPDIPLIVLARSNEEETANTRVRKSLARFVDDPVILNRLGICEILDADITDARSLETPLLDDVTHVLHLASNTNLRAVRGVRHTNLFGGLILAHRMRRVPGLRRYIHVGTAYICGENQHRVVTEMMYPRVRARHFTEYTSSKAECELLLQSTAPELPLIIARPSIVLGHTRLGCRPTSSIFWFFRACDALRRLTCPLESVDDVVPVDWVAQALAHLLFKPELKYDCYHLSAGHISSVPWTEIARVLAQCYGERPDEPYRIVSYAEINREWHHLREKLGSQDDELILNALEIYYRFMSLKSEIFENTRIMEEGVPPPPKLTSYLARCAEIPAGKTVYQQLLDDV